MKAIEVTSCDAMRLEDVVDHMAIAASVLFASRLLLPAYLTSLCRGNLILTVDALVSPLSKGGANQSEGQRLESI
jgi:hypothetical protein